ncbi:PalH-domain-containing protein [Lindgomyces ingoldianus]|uniref:PalH-domain-containing protein n=1 Tax=Lindgomyces ingoldianus TaxID=673940 RepID=A0ACB6QHQ1_9PLEO|nr:PalH-domain-containing protein [Lindgomyces ingoldianus]KAF2466103.1 PalH-domain-containing protein [Lindgomyces ingoldianus]
MDDPARVRRAQLFDGQPTTTESYRHCVPFKLPSDGVIQINPEYAVTLTADAVFTPQCTSAQKTQALGEEMGGVTSISDMRDPFHASITPQAYATGAATVIAWMLVIMLLITPRTFFVGGSGGRSGLMGRRGIIGGATGGGSIIGVGTRPWLQKVAALTVAISLTLATADTFKIAEVQYKEGFMDAMKLRDEVVSGMEIKVSRVISDVFLWLAQVQTLIRLFPRHKEKVIIKWVGFALIVLDITFSSLNSFGPYNDNGRPRHFETAIPALSYLFQLSLSMLYAAWVMYYAITKRRYAFYHSMMWNITIVALLSLVAILTPVVFFITDISNYTIAGWGDYFRWVGAAAASVIVWEWVERIEALEREERKDGILGREIYDGDEMLETTPSLEVSWPRPHRNSWVSDNGDPKKPGDGGAGGGGAFASGAAGHSFSSLAQRLGRSRIQRKTEAQKKRTIHIPPPAPALRRSESGQRSNRNSRSYIPLQSPLPIPVISSPVSRTDTTSADSTVYTIRYHPISNSPPTVRHPVSVEDRLGRTPSNSAQNTQGHSANEDPEKASEEAERTQGRSRWHWQAVANPFRRRGRSPPPEVQRGRVIEPLGIEDVSANIPPRNYTGLALKDRLGTLAAQQGERFRKKSSGGQQTELNLPVTIIPAQPRGRTWSPEILLQQQPQVSSTAGVQVSRDPPRSVPMGTEIHDTPSTPQLYGSPNPADATQEPSGSPSHHNSRVRFTPETFLIPGTRQSVDTEARMSPHPHSVISLGTEKREPQASDSSLKASNEQSANATNIANGRVSPTNHNR